MNAGVLDLSLQLQKPNTNALAKTAGSRARKGKGRTGIKPTLTLKGRKVFRKGQAPSDGPIVLL